MARRCHPVIMHMVRTYGDSMILTEQREPWPEASGCCRDVGQHGSAAAKPCWASLLETDEQNTEHVENANMNMGKCDDYTISPEKLLG